MHLCKIYLPDHNQGYDVIMEDEEEEILEKYFKECEEVEKKESEKLLKIIEVLKKDEV